MTDELQTDVLDIDVALEKKAASNNLSVINVKSILHHILKDDAVVSMAKKLVEEDSSDHGEVEKPIMTRSRVRQFTKSADVDIGVKDSAEMSSREKATFKDVDFPSSDSSDDEEYQPGQDEQTSFCSNADYPMTDNESDIHGTPVMVSTPTAAIEDQAMTNEALIANRTRSKLPLKDTPLSLLEAALQIPEVMPTTSTLCDGDDQEWQRWLQELFCSDQTTVVVPEEEDDAEYNVYADLHSDEDYEELRNDRAVHISQKEVDGLMEELLKTCEDDDLLMPTNSVEVTQQGTVPMISCQLTQEQSTTVCKQLQQHFQLLLQTFLLSRYEPSLMFIAQLCSKAMNEIIDQSDAPDGAIPSWAIPHLEDGKELIAQLDPSNDSVDHPWVDCNRHIIPEPVINIIMNYELFWDFPQLLPTTGFAPLSSNSTESAAQNRVKFTAAEDNLLVLGLDHYENAWDKITVNLLPTKTSKQLQIHAKNLRSSRTADNVVKHFCKTKEVKIPFKEEPPVQLPNWVMAYQQRKAGEKSSNGGSSTGVSSPASVSGKKSQQRVVPKSSSRFPHDQQMTDVLASAGLEVSDYTARFSYCYLMEIKSAVGGTVYEELLKVLLDAERCKLSQSETYGKVSEILAPWPQLLKIFSDYLECSEAIKANLSQKIEVSHAKQFLSRLQERFKTCPQKFDDMLATLDQPDLPLDQLRQQALSLLKEHQDLTRDLHCFLLRICPPPTEADTYEEVNLLSGSNDKLDQFEDMAITDGKRKSRSCDSRAVKAPRGKKRKRNDDVVR
ncbi:GON-4-like protein isoform X2 [Dysidea avara]|uniref:GON-4-like protein isoform X2 n=1 Tax=Dysidea avara TaxID=196820 RepID=UPI003321C1D7